jgi:SAM-dependent methyltransferase/uncharacterized protein YbaR (Trm112 family)
MHPKFLDFLCCPETGEALALHADVRKHNGMVITGSLHSPSGQAWPIIHGIPRFITVHTPAAAPRPPRWNRIRFEFENFGRPMETHTRRMWERVTDQRGSVRGQTIVEFGCGTGRFLDIARGKGACIVGIENSSAAEAARKNFIEDPNVLILQADYLSPPLRDGAFDGAFAIGLPSRLQNPLGAVSALARAVRSDGWVACSANAKGEFPDWPSMRLLRRFHRVLTPYVGEEFARAYAFLSAFAIAPVFNLAKSAGIPNVAEYLEQNWLCSPRMNDAFWREVETFEAIVEPLANVYDGAQVRSWLERSGCAAVRTTYWSGASVAGVRSAVQSQAIHAVAA